MSSVCAPHTCDEGDPDLHPPGEREHQEVQHFDQVCGLALCCHGVTLQNTYRTINTPTDSTTVCLQKNAKSIILL